MARIEQPNLDDAAEAWLVYGDALQADGDPRGELVALNHAVAGGASPAKRDAHLDAHAAALFGPLADHRRSVEIAWRYSVPETVSVRVQPGQDGGALVAALFGSPIGAQMRRLRLVGVPSGGERVDLGSALAAVSKLPATCTALEVVDERARTSTKLVSSDYGADQNLVAMNGLESVWKIGHLASFEIVAADLAQLTFGTIVAPNLHTFVLRGLAWPTSYGRPSDLGGALAAATWPALRRMVLQLPETFTYSWPDQTGAYVREERYDEENEEYGYDDDGYNDTNWALDLVPIVSSLSKTAIERLTLSDFASGASVLRALQEAGLPPTLQTLDLSDSDLNDANLNILVEHRDTFARLKTLDLRRTHVTDVSSLADLGPTVLHEPEGGRRYEFSVGME